MKATLASLPLEEQRESSLPEWQTATSLNEKGKFTVLLTSFLDHLYKAVFFFGLQINYTYCGHFSTTK